MVDTFNAKIVTDPNTGKPYPSLTVTTYGIPYLDDSSGSKPVPVDDPVETFLGGPGGYYVVQGEVRCTDPSRCDLECLPPAAQSDLITTTYASADSYSPMPTALQGDRQPDPLLRCVQSGRAVRIPSHVQLPPEWGDSDRLHGADGRAFAIPHDDLHAREDPNHQRSPGEGSRRVQHRDHAPKPALVRADRGHFFPVRQTVQW